MLSSRIEHYATSLYAVVSSEWSTDSVDIGWQRSSGQRHRLSQRHHCFTPDPTTTTGASTVVHHYSIWVVSSDLCYEQHAYKSCRRKMNGICASSVDLGIVVLFGCPLPWNLVVDTWIIHVLLYCPLLLCIIMSAVWRCISSNPENLWREWAVENRMWVCILEQHGVPWTVPCVSLHAVRDAEHRLRQQSEINAQQRWKYCTRLYLLWFCPHMSASV